MASQRPVIMNGHVISHICRLVQVCDPSTSPSVSSLQRAMKGKNKPTRRHRKKQENIIEEKKPKIKAKASEVGNGEPVKLEMRGTR